LCASLGGCHIATTSVAPRLNEFRTHGPTTVCTEMGRIVARRNAARCRLTITRVKPPRAWSFCHCRLSGEQHCNHQRDELDDPSHRYSAEYCHFGFPGASILLSSAMAGGDSLCLRSVLLARCWGTNGGMFKIGHHRWPNSGKRSGWRVTILRSISSVLFAKHRLKKCASR
jgi:hypothetical protein